jgi:glyoxylase-like metal-dependent hydrolase (beta-lactamase superfamily II)
MRAIGLDPDRVIRIIIGHGHWDHAGQLSEFPNAVIYVQAQELEQIDFFLDYPVAFNGGHIRLSTRSTPSPGNRSDRRSRLARAAPSVAIRRRRCKEIWARSSAGKAKIVDGRHEVAPG